jgi:hypothetical protein
MVPPKSPRYTPANPSLPRHHVLGQKFGIGKFLSPPLGRGERESIDSNLGSVWHTRLPQLIHGPPEIWAYTNSDNEVEEENADIKELREKLSALKLKLNNMDECMAESGIERMDLDDKIDNLQKAVCSKIKRLAKSTGNEDLYRARTRGIRWVVGYISLGLGAEFYLSNFVFQSFVFQQHLHLK